MQLRSSPRIYVRYPASVQTDNGAAEGILFDLSATGCRMQSNVALTQGSYLALHIEAPETESPLAVEVSIVRWHKDNQFGIEFLRYAQGVRDRVTDLVEGSEVLAVSNLAEDEELPLSTVAMSTISLSSANCL
ncbi:MAG: PilZ domain-containing protein [Nitrospira sp.]|nr:PilZ domain-containing protein [Nitrospira sp.]